MPKFYVTYPKGSLFEKNYSVVHAEDYDSAYDKVADTLTIPWSALFTHEQFFGTSTIVKYPSQAECFGLTEIPLEG